MANESTQLLAVDLTITVSLIAIWTVRRYLLERDAGSVGV
jgi:hypothetical protein